MSNYGERLYLFPDPSYLRYLSNIGITYYNKCLYPRNDTLRFVTVFFKSPNDTAGVGTIDTLVVVKDRGLVGFSTYSGRRYELVE